MKRVVFLLALLIAVPAFAGSPVADLTCKPDLTQTLTINPWATYFGGSGNETAYSVAVDGNGNTYVCQAPSNPPTREVLMYLSRSSMPTAPWSGQPITVAQTMKSEY